MAPAFKQAKMCRRIIKNAWNVGLVGKMKLVVVVSP
ncbi:thymidylate synthase [Lentilactobacillus hilgardii]|nr:thymidylate synthase [Lentilactobacillus hilgardii]